MTGKKGKYHYPGDLRREYVEVGVRIFNEKEMFKFNGPCITSIVKELDVTSAALYHYYPKKSDLDDLIVVNVAINKLVESSKKLEEITIQDIERVIMVMVANSISSIVSRVDLDKIKEERGENNE